MKEIKEEERRENGKRRKEGNENGKVRAVDDTTFMSILF
jgi:hypothetical protein